MAGTSQNPTAETPRPSGKRWGAEEHGPLRLAPRVSPVSGVASLGRGRARRVHARRDGRLHRRALEHVAHCEHAVRADAARHVQDRARLVPQRAALERERHAAPATRGSDMPASATSMRRKGVGGLSTIIMGVGF